MCEYCEMCGDDPFGESIFDMPLDFGILEDYLELDVCIDTDDGNLIAHIIDSENFSPKSEVFATKKINYCPMCGRKLIKE